EKLVWIGVYFGAGLEAGALEVPELGLAEISFFTNPAEEEHFSTVPSFCTYFSNPIYSLIMNAFFSFSFKQ
ncbi:unnamed protein product, partial [Sphenostylis stenocarpa]